MAAVAVTAVFAALAYRLGMVSAGGAAGGMVIGTLVYAGLGAPGFAVLALFVVGGSLLTRLGYERKRRSGTAEARGGRRGAKNALANGGVAVACALLASATPYGEGFAAAFVAALGAAFADTAESEIGQLAGGSPRLITTMQKVRPGTDGAVSLAGTLAGVAAAGITAALGAVLGLAGELAPVAAAAFLGTVVDSLIGALAPRIGNELTNVSGTLAAAGAAFVLIGWF
ncbi:DUF92 domain-containing protein [Rubrobacter xylanophilus]|uniref:DUF92 domain-containing protein n=1 Tax=Rubrobacter xylanophilus TaxID=49319 RepID=UPI001FCA8956|nr:DUF92 domain-containing protein [Rubrobacter xylanophilus]